MEEEEVEKEEESGSDIKNESELSEIPFGEGEENDKEEEESEDDMSSSSNHRAGSRGRSARTRRTDLSLTYTLNGLTVNFTLATPPKNVLRNLGVVSSCTSRPVHGSDAKQKMVEAIDQNQYSKFKEKIQYPQA